MFHNKQNLASLCLVLLLSCSAICASQLDVSLKNAEMPPPETSSTSSSSTTSTTTTTTTTTAAPPDTTTTSTTTTSTSTSTSTTRPTTTTSKPEPITTPKPAPYPNPNINQWNSSCILVRMAAQLNFTYDTKDNKMATTLYNIPHDASVNDAECSFNTSQTLQINWGPKDAQHIMSLSFDMKNNTSQLTMIRFDLPLTSADFPNAKENQTIQLIHHKAEFSVPSKMSYHCTRSQTFNLTETLDNNTIVGTLTLSDVQLEAFRVDNSTMFSTARDCDSSDTSDVVPIAVGIALVALILVVLIAYLCARRRSTNSGYMSF